MRAGATIPIGAAASSVVAVPWECGPNFVCVPLEAPLNWLAGPSLVPGNIMAGYHADLSSYTAESWLAYVLEQCKSFAACTSSLSFSDNNSGSTGGRYWFGEVFRGGATTAAQYVRDAVPKDGIADSIAYTIVY